jgi:hypothetical protein
LWPSISPRSSRRWTFRGGPKREDIFRAFSTGLNGTPMPSFVDALSLEQRWDLANYTYSLSESDAPSYATVVMAKKVQKEIDPNDAKLFEAKCVLSGDRSIIQPGREFHPPCNGISVRTVCETDIAFNRGACGRDEAAGGRDRRTGSEDERKPPEAGGRGRQTSGARRQAAPAEESKAASGRSRRRRSAAAAASSPTRWRFSCQCSRRRCKPYPIFEQRR